MRNLLANSKQIVSILRSSLSPKLSLIFWFQLSLQHKVSHTPKFHRGTCNKLQNTTISLFEDNNLYGKTENGYWQLGNYTARRKLILYFCIAKKYTLLAQILKTPSIYNLKSIALVLQHFFYIWTRAFTLIKYNLCLKLTYTHTTVREPWKADKHYFLVYINEDIYTQLMTIRTTTILIDWS